VHKARKALKKARAALRLLREGLDDAAFRAENAALRDAGRCLAPLRDVKAAFGALDELRRRYPEEMRRLDLQKLKDSLQGERQRTRHDILRSGAAPEKCARLLKRSLARAEEPDFARIGSQPLDQGLERIYRKGRKAFARAMQSGTDDALHEWRKQVKYLLNALDVLYGPAQGKRAKAAQRAGKLADRLGDEHDLVALSLRTQAPRGLQPVIEWRRARLKKRAFALGRKLYRQKAKRFVERVTSSS
jgi:CHAD domain-containing protein